MTIKLGTHTSYDKRTTPIDFQGQGSKVEVTRYTLLLNLVNMIHTEPFQLWPSNLVRTLLMTRGWHLYIFKVMGQRSKINPFYIANYKVISLFKSPVGRILQRWRCFGIFAIIWLCCRRGHPCFTNTCLVFNCTTVVVVERSGSLN